MTIPLTELTRRLRRRCSCRADLSADWRAGWPAHGYSEQRSEARHVVRWWWCCCCRWGAEGVVWSGMSGWSCFFLVMSFVCLFVLCVFSSSSCSSSIVVVAASSLFLLLSRLACLLSQSFLVVHADTQQLATQPGVAAHTYPRVRGRSQ
ncbi:uncharacterized protein IWZ02DRAFT_302435 [Phyllosticta citriasiana]|uniref:uncharacterized protein n=1 Tax=Phyllosticta citriasiana TaxID=595635 RepID=UPI0030FD7E36